MKETREECRDWVMQGMRGWRGITLETFDIATPLKGLLGEYEASELYIYIYR